jgi:hypothetical protein
VQFGDWSVRLPTRVGAVSGSEPPAGGVEDDRPRRSQQRGESVGGVHATLLGGAKDGREALLRLCATRGAVAAAAHFAGEDGGAQCVLGAPGGRIERRVEEEAKDGVVLGDEMSGEAASGGQAAQPLFQQAPPAIDIAAARDGETVVGHDAVAVANPRDQRRTEQLIDRRGKRMMGIVQHHRATAPAQMRETRLMRGVRELVGRRPPVALQDAGIVGAEDRGGLRTAAPVLNRVDRGVWRGEGVRSPTASDPRAADRFRVPGRR